MVHDPRFYSATDLTRIAKGESDIWGKLSLMTLVGRKVGVVRGSDWL
jgi:hypothetical protein